MLKRNIYSKCSYFMIIYRAQYNYKNINGN